MMYKNTTPMINPFKQAVVSNVYQVCRMSRQKITSRWHSKDFDREHIFCIYSMQYVYIINFYILCLRMCVYRYMVSVGNGFKATHSKYNYCTIFTIYIQYIPSVFTKIQLFSTYTKFPDYTIRINMKILRNCSDSYSRLKIIKYKSCLYKIVQINQL